ncbi:MAG: AMP-binding protein [Planctomycetota bacterium]|nr:AMP-binding protein [Planctomycetota bacterium]
MQSKTVERISDSVRAHAAQRGAALAAVDGLRCLDWTDLLVAMEAAVAALRGQGVQPGDRVALVAGDGVSALVVALAVIDMGAVHVPLDHHLTDLELGAEIARLSVNWCCDDPAALRLRATGFPRIDDPLGGTAAFLRCSSGTTGDAKGVLLSHHSMIARCDAANQLLKLGPDDRVLWLLPMAYHFAVSIGLYVRCGAAVVFGAALRATRTAAIAREHQVTMCYASPYHVQRLAALAPSEDLPASLRQVIATTAALAPDTAHLFRQRHGLGVRQGLGLIEVGLPLLSPGAAGEVPGYLGQPASAYRVRVIDDDGAQCERGGTGELQIAGPGLWDAYLDPLRLRAECLVDGYFATGDLASIDTSGAVTLLGRSKEMINVGGVKVFPLEVEAVLAAHPEVTACRVRSGSDPRTGEAVVAEVESAAPAVDLVPHLQAWCRERLAALKCPARYAVVPRLERTASGKVRRSGTA